MNVFLAWFDPIRQQDCTEADQSWHCRHHVICYMLRDRDGSELIGPQDQEGRFFGGKQLKKESISKS
jgi:hypothetical protein